MRSLQQCLCAADKGKWSLHDTFEVYSFKQIKELYETGATDVVVLALVHITVEKGSDNKNEYKLDFAYSANEKKMDENGFNPQDFKSLILFPIEQLNELDYLYKNVFGNQFVTPGSNKRRYSL